MKIDNRGPGMKVDDGGSGMKVDDGGSWMRVDALDIVEQRIAKPDLDVQDSIVLADVYVGCVMSDDV